jgi:TRAP-type C4-dicarboxylate transport system permease small subunit
MPRGGILTPVKLVPPTLFFWLVLAGTAMAQNEQEPAGDNGEGLAGETTDKVVTFFSLGVAIFFVLVVTLGSIAQILLERRKERRKAAHFQRYGW